MFRIIAFAVFLCAVLLCEGGRIKRADKTTSTAKPYGRALKAPIYTKFSNNTQPTSRAAATNTAMPMSSAAPAMFNFTATTSKRALHYKNNNNENVNPKITANLHTRLMRHATESMNWHKQKQTKHYAVNENARQPPRHPPTSMYELESRKQRQQHQKDEEEQCKLPYAEIETTCMRDTPTGQRITAHSLEDSMHKYKSTVVFGKSNHDAASPWNCLSKARLLFEKSGNEEPQTRNSHNGGINKLKAFLDEPLAEQMNFMRKIHSLKGNKMPVDSMVSTTYDEKTNDANNKVLGLRTYEVRNTFSDLDNSCDI